MAEGNGSPRLNGARYLMVNMINAALGRGDFPLALARVEAAQGSVPAKVLAPLRDHVYRLEAKRCLAVARGRILYHDEANGGLRALHRAYAYFDRVGLPHPIDAPLLEAKAHMIRTDSYLREAEDALDAGDPGTTRGRLRRAVDEFRAYRSVGYAGELISGDPSERIERVRERLTRTSPPARASSPPACPRTS